MPLVGHISGSTFTNSAIGITGSVVIASKPATTFPLLDPGIKFLVDEASLFKSTLVSSGSLTIKDSTGAAKFTVDASSGNTTVGGTFGSVGAATFSLGLSGSLTRLANGSSYIEAGTGISVLSSSNGSITISATGGGGTPGGASTQVQFNDGGSFGGDEGLTYNKSTEVLSANSLQVTGSAGLSVTTTANILQSITGSSTLTLAGAALLNGGIIADSGAFQVADTSGNISTLGTLNVAQSITGSSTLTLSAAALLNGGTQTTTLGVSNTATFNGDVDLGNAITDTVSFTARVDTSVLPLVDNAVDLGSATQRWANVYTGDLHLRNDRGDYTLIEEPDFLSIRFNKTGKRYKFLLEAVPELDEPSTIKF